MGERHVIRDVLHGYVFFDDLDRSLIDCRFIQRLRHIRQNDVASLVYPSLNTSRFEHSLGVMHLAGLLAESALATSETSEAYLQALGAALEPLQGADIPTVRNAFCRAARWYGLLHDIGHLPFSHLTEHCLDSYRDALYGGTSFSALHEAAGEYLLNHEPDVSAAMSEEPATKDLVMRLMRVKKVPSILQPLKDIVDSDVDADRIDATARDGLLSGGDFGNYDISRLTRHARLWHGDAAQGQEWRVFFTTRAESAVESLLIERVKTYRWIHYKPKVVAFKNAYRCCFECGVKAENVGRWHAKEYATDNGFLADSSAWSMIETLSAQPEYVMNARGALLWRWDSVRPLWKRREEFRSLSARVVRAYSDRWWDIVERRYPALNLLVWTGSDWLTKLEDRLNEGLEEQSRFLIMRTAFKPFSPDAIGAGKVGAHWLIRHKEGSLLRITDESRLVAALADSVKTEAAFGVTVVGPRNKTRDRIPEMQERFVKLAGEVMEELGSGMPTDRRDEFVREALGS